MHKTKSVPSTVVIWGELDRFSESLCRTAQIIYINKLVAQQWIWISKTMVESNSTFQTFLKYNNNFDFFSKPTNCSLVLLLNTKFIE